MCLFVTHPFPHLTGEALLSGSISLKSPTVLSDRGISAHPLKEQYENVFDTFQTTNSALLREDLEKRLSTNLALTRNRARDRNKLIEEQRQVTRLSTETEGQLTDMRQLISEIGKSQPEDQQRIALRLKLRVQLRRLLTKIILVPATRERRRQGKFDLPAWDRRFLLVDPNAREAVLPEGAILFFQSGESRGVCVSDGQVHGWEEIAPKEMVPGKLVRTIYRF